MDSGCGDSDFNRCLSISKLFGQYICFLYRWTNAKLICLPLLKLEYEVRGENSLFRNVQKSSSMYFVLTEVKPVHIVSEVRNAVMKDTDLPTSWECLRRIWKDPACLRLCRQNTLSIAQVPSRDLTPPNGVATHYVAWNSEGKHSVRVFILGRKKGTRPAARLCEKGYVYKFCA